MARKYRKIEPRIWKDESFRKLSIDEKLMAFYLITAQSNRVGLFTFSPAMGAEDLGLPLAKFQRAFDRVLAALEWVYDASTRVLWIPTWWRYNQPENENHFKGCLADVTDLPASGLIGVFLGHRSDLPAYAIRVLDTYAIGIGYLYEDGRYVSDTYTHTLPIPYRYPTDSYGISGAGAETEIEDPAPALRAEFLEDFERWRATLPTSARVAPTDQRFDKYRARRKDSSREEIQQALAGWTFDPWPERARNNGFELLIRNRGQVEKFSRLYRENAPSEEAPLAHGAKHINTGALWDAARREFVPAEDWKPIEVTQ